jgi:PAS domain S-box-containing protein
LPKLVEAVPVGIGILDLKGNVYSINRMVEEMTGYSQEEFKTINVGETYAEAKDRREMLKILEETGKVRDYTVRMKRKDGTAFYALLNIDQIELGGQRVLLMAQQDITALKKAEEEITRLNKDLESRVVRLNKDLESRVVCLSALNRELERSNRDLEQFAYVASHDLQEPLRMISSFTQLLEQRYKEKLDKSADEFIKFIVEGANRMQRMINDLLSYSRLSTRGTPFEPVNSEEILARVHTDLLPLIEENQALLTHESLPEITADASQMLHLFQNLIGNAIKFRGKEPPRVHVFSESREEEWMFGVRDNGIGIAKEYFDRIFVIFQRLHSREEYSGTGIGLAICKKIVEGHDGRIWVESEPGKGSTFFFTIPKRRE